MPEIYQKQGEMQPVPFSRGVLSQIYGVVMKILFGEQS